MRTRSVCLNKQPFICLFCFYKANCKNREELRYFAADTKRKSEIRRKNIRFEKYEKFKNDENDQEGYEKHEIVEGKKLSGNYESKQSFTLRL